MKISKNLVALLLCAALCVCMLAGCTRQETVTSKLEHLAAPANVTVNYGDSAYSSEDDTVSFDAVEGAVSYQVYVYQDGDTTAKVTSGTATTIELPDPLDSGSYKVSVVAVADKQTKANSVGSEAVTYTVDEVPPAVTLGTVSNITMDFSNIDEDASKYPTVSFTPVEGASRYLVDVYAANKNYEKQLTSLGYTTRFTVPADQAAGYMIDSTNYGDLMPGWYVVSVTAIGDDLTTLTGEAVEANVAWVGVKNEKPVLSATEQENGGIQLALDNYDAFWVGLTVDITIYADEACTQVVKTDSITYTTSESFGNITHNNTLAVKIKDAAEAAPDELATGVTYYAVASLDPEIYVGETSDVVAFTCAKAGDGKAASGGGMGGMPGGMGGGGGASGWEVKPEGTSFNEGAESFAFTIGTQPFFNTTAELQAEPDEGSTYTYKLAKGDPAAPFDCDMFLQLKADGTAVVTVTANGPIAASEVNGTWTADGGVITVTFE